VERVVWHFHPTGWRNPWMQQEARYHSYDGVRNRRYLRQ
jgi:hypothetical protein